ncbi:Metallo-dependent hydrolase [Penicillium verhagenii]|uniref:Metallo-dependent hydrolase n=1 Tax=Penicillium verhagenii TaxID=1562060 RepID=UPI002544FF2F|nr:Metallo-dependent hydrolase [Penicillium verhagenii]KAJ5915687.1 Metallo-dependent hydrolase [Penicillium verhagenii]
MTTMDSAKPVDESFTKALPKVELHAHLSGSISRQCLHEIWKNKKAKDPDLQVEDPLVLMPPGKVDYTLQTFFQVFSKLIYQLCNDLESLAYATNSVLQDFHNDGVRYLELRTIPRASPNTQITREEYLTTVLDTISAFKRSTANKTPNEQMSVFLILALDRGNTTAAEAEEIIDLAIANKSRGVVGVDLCGNPTQGDVTIYRDAFARAKAHGLGLTLHFAETPASGGRDELAALLSFRPDRLGHVIHVPDDVKAEIVKRGLGLELCMSCNVHAKLIDGGFLDHHFGSWRHEDCPIALCTDDVGFFCSPVSNEYLLAAQHFELDRTQLLRICRKSVDMIFGGDSEKQRLRRTLDEFAGSMGRADWFIARNFGIEVNIPNQLPDV